jgi:hypothetical protein
MIFPSEKSSQAENAVFLSNLVQNKRNEKRYTIPLPFITERTLDEKLKN